jgi:hypothetical protein
VAVSLHRRDSRLADHRKRVGSLSPVARDPAVRGGLPHRPRPALPFCAPGQEGEELRSGSLGSRLHPRALSDSRSVDLSQRRLRPGRRPEDVAARRHRRGRRRVPCRGDALLALPAQPHGASSGGRRSDLLRRDDPNADDHVPLEPHGAHAQVRLAVYFCSAVFD